MMLALYTYVQDYRIYLRNERTLCFGKERSQEDLSCMNQERFRDTRERGQMLWHEQLRSGYNNNDAIAQTYHADSPW